MINIFSSRKDSNKRQCKGMQVDFILYTWCKQNEISSNRHSDGATQDESCGGEQECISRQMKIIPEKFKSPTFNSTPVFATDLLLCSRSRPGAYMRVCLASTCCSFFFSARHSGQLANADRLLALACLRLYFIFIYLFLNLTELAQPDKMLDML